MNLVETIDTKRAQLANGFYQSGSGPLKVLLIGSCRTLFYLNYLIRANQGNAMTIYRIDPTDWNWNDRDEIVNLEDALNRCETDERILRVLRDTKIYIHEYYAYYGMWNSSPEAEKNIYQFGLMPSIDVCIPNFHDRFVLFQEQVNVGRRPPWVGDLKLLGLEAIEKFCSICALTSFPDFAEHFRDTWTKTRYFWTGNHISRHFALWMFRAMNDRFLRLSLDDSFWSDIEQFNQFSTPCTPVTQDDVDAYGLAWDCAIEQLKL